MLTISTAPSGVLLANSRSSKQRPLLLPLRRQFANESASAEAKGWFQVLTGFLLPGVQCNVVLPVVLPGVQCFPTCGTLVFYMQYCLKHRHPGFITNIENLPFTEMMPDAMQWKYNDVRCKCIDLQMFSAPEESYEVTTCSVISYY